MHRTALYAAYGWLAFISVSHFTIDVVSQYLRGIRSPSEVTTAYYGLNTAFAFGQLLFGLLGLWIAVKMPSLLSEWPAVALSLSAAAVWLAISFLFMEYWEPKLATSVYAALIIWAAAVG